MKAGLAQIDSIPGDFQGNSRKILAAYRDLTAQGAEVVITPEMALCGLSPQDLLFRPRFAIQAAAALETLASEIGTTPLIVGHLIANPNPGRPFFNAALVLQHGQVVAEIAKTFSPGPDLHDEHRAFEPSPSPIALLDLGGETIGVLIGSEVDDDARIASLKEAGATALLHLGSTSLLARDWQRPARRLAHLARQHRLAIMSCQPTGGHVTRVYPGGSLAVNKEGGICGHLPLFEEAHGLLDLAAAPITLPKRDPIAIAHDAIILALRDYVRKNGFKSVVLGLSGGLDSAVVAALAVEALGKENVHGVAMPTEYSSESSVNDALDLARNLSIECPVLSIQSPFDAFRSVMAETFDGLTPDLTEENMQPRLRGMVVMALSNKFGHLALATGNKSELAMGYCTLYGDMAGGYAPISDLYKTEAYALAHYLNREREIIPRSTIEKPPSAELRPDQTDQDTLPPYEQLDEILLYLIEEERTPYELAANGHDPELVNFVSRRLEFNEYKRQQGSPGPQLSARAFGPDRRLPLIHRFSDPAA